MKFKEHAFFVSGLPVLVGKMASNLDRAFSSFVLEYQQFDKELNKAKQGNQGNILYLDFSGLQLFF